jgi:hypothetical protein
VGRCIAEQKVNAKTVALTLTYAETPCNFHKSAVLYYPDVQQMLKRLRRHYSDMHNGARIRFLCAGEYGTKFGRAHWHIVLFFDNSCECEFCRLPPVEAEKQMWRLWPWGYTYVQRPDPDGFRYVAKYVVKNEGDEVQTRNLQMSKKPPLGHEYFMSRASKLAQEKLALSSWEYYFPDARYPDGNFIRFYLQGKTQENYFVEYWNEYVKKWGEEPPMSDQILHHYDSGDDRLLHVENKKQVSIPRFDTGKPPVMPWVKGLTDRQGRGMVMKDTSGRYFYFGEYSNGPTGERWKPWLAELVTRAEIRQAVLGVLPEPQDNPANRAYRIFLEQSDAQTSRASRTRLGQRETIMSFPEILGEWTGVPF